MPESAVCPFSWNECAHTLSILDQRALPDEERFIELKTPEDYVRAISEMIVRGAPAIGIAAAFGVYASARRNWNAQNKEERIRADIASLAQTRPTAVNLFWALKRMDNALRSHIADPDPQALLGEAFGIWREDVEMNRKMAAVGADRIGSVRNVLTHCNAGALATGGIGTALGIIRELHARSRHTAPIHVWTDETRPFLQGARLTAWELMRDGIDCTLIADSMAACLMKQKRVDAVIVGADRVAQNGDIANKIGTYGLAVSAKFHNIPFYVAVPDSTVDPHIKSGEDIVIEERSASEVTQIKNTNIAPKNAKAYNPAFDITPAALITAIITPEVCLGPSEIKDYFKI